MKTCTRACIILLVAITCSIHSTPANAAGTAPTVSIVMSDTTLTVGETSNVYFTFSEAPLSFTLGDVTASGGTLSNLVSTSSLEYQALFTPTANSSQASNRIFVSPKVTMRNYLRGDDYDYPIAVAYDGTNIWAANYLPDGSIFKMAPDGTFTKYAGDGQYHRAMAFDGTNMWATNIFDDSVTKFSPTGVPTTYTSVGASPQSIAFDGTNMWTANNYDDSVTKIDPTGTLTTYTGTGAGPRGIAFDGTNMWTANAGNNSVTKITPSGTMTTYTGTGAAPTGLAFDGINMWTVNSSGNSVTKVTPSGTMTTYTGTDVQPISIVFDGTNMWTGNYNNHTVTKVTPSGTMTTYTGLSGSPYGMIFDGANIWSANLGATPGLTKIGFTATTNSASYIINTLRRASIINFLVQPKGFTDASGKETMLDFKINGGAKTTNTPTVNLQLNGDPRYVRGYAVSLDSTFRNEGIHPYSNTNLTVPFSLPNKPGTYTLYMQYFSSTGHKSEVIKKEISYVTPKITAKAPKKKTTQSIRLRV